MVNNFIKMAKNKKKSNQPVVKIRLPSEVKEAVKEELSGEGEPQNEGKAGLISDAVLQKPEKEVSVVVYKGPSRPRIAYGMTSFFISLINLAIVIPFGILTAERLPFVPYAVYSANRIIPSAVSIFGQLFLLVALLFAVTGVSLAAKQKEIGETRQSRIALIMNICCLVLTFSLIGWVIYTGGNL